MQAVLARIKILHKLGYQGVAEQFEAVRERLLLLGEATGATAVQTTIESLAKSSTAASQTLHYTPIVCSGT